MKIALADDQPLVRNAIASLLEAHGHHIVGEANDGQEALQLVRQTRPELVLMDLGMPIMDGLEATRLIKAEFPDVRIVILTVSDHEQDLVEAVKSGAHGYLLKDLQADEFLEAIEAIARGQPVLPQRLAHHLWTEFGRLLDSERELAPGQALTDREWEVLRLVAAGYTNREVGERLSISTNTVKFHTRGILEKLHLRNRAQVIAWAHQHADRQTARRDPYPDG